MNAALASRPCDVPGCVRPRPPNSLGLTLGLPCQTRRRPREACGEVHGRTARRVCASFASSPSKDSSGSRLSSPPQAAFGLGHGARSAFPRPALPEAASPAREAWSYPWTAPKVSVKETDARRAHRAPRRARAHRRRGDHRDRRSDAGRGEHLSRAAGDALRTPPPDDSARGHPGPRAALRPRGASDPRGPPRRQQRAGPARGLRGAGRPRRRRLGRAHDPAPGRPAGVGPRRGRRGPGGVQRAERGRPARDLAQGRALPGAASRRGAEPGRDRRSRSGVGPVRAGDPDLPRAAGGRPRGLGARYGPGDPPRGAGLGRGAPGGRASGPALGARSPGRRPARQPGASARAARAARLTARSPRAGPGRPEQVRRRPDRAREPGAHATGPRSRGRAEGDLRPPAAPGRQEPGARRPLGRRQERARPGARAAPGHRARARADPRSRSDHRRGPLGHPLPGASGRRGSRSCRTRSRPRTGRSGTSPTSTAWSTPARRSTRTRASPPCSCRPSSAAS